MQVDRPQANFSSIVHLSLLAGLFFGCTSTRVERIHPNERVELSGNWNDTDSRLTADEMIGDCLSAPWLPSATSHLHRRPTLLISSISNETSEHINTNTLLEEFQQALINSKKVMFVASSGERDHLREELANQPQAKFPNIENSTDEIAADYMLSGVISSVLDQDRKRRLIYYQVNLKLLDMRSSQIVWNGEKKIKKFIGRPNEYW